MSLLKGFLTFGSLTMVSRVAGFVRDVLTAAMLGAGPVADAFIVAQRLPNLFRSLFAEGAFSAAFVPFFTKVKHESGLEAARQFAAQVQAVVLVILLAFVGLVMVFMPQMMLLIAPGFGDDPYKFSLAVTFGLITFPYLIFISLTALQGGVLNALGKIAPFAAVPIILNIVLIIALVGVAPFTGDAGHVLSWGMMIGGVLQFAWLLYHCRRAGMKLPWQRPTLPPHVREFFKKLGPGVIGAGATQFNIAISTILASLLPTGAVAYLYYADRLNQLPLGVIGMALAVVLLPLLSQAVQENNKSKITNMMSRGVDLALAFGLPAAVALVLLAEPILHVLFARGEFTAADAAATAPVLVAYALGIPAFMLVKIFAARFFAAGDTKTPVRIALLAVASNIALAVWLMPQFGAPGIALATSLATMVNAAFLAWRLAQQGGLHLDSLARARALKIIFATAAMGFVAYAMAQLLHGYLMAAPLLVEYAALAVVIGAGGSVYTALLHLTRALPMTEIQLLLRGSKQARLNTNPQQPISGE